MKDKKCHSRGIKKCLVNIMVNIKSSHPKNESEVPFQKILDYVQSKQWLRLLPSRWGGLVELCSDMEKPIRVQVFTNTFLLHRSQGCDSPRTMPVKSLLSILLIYFLTLLLELKSLEGCSHVLFTLVVPSKQHSLIPNSFPIKIQWVAVQIC